VVMLMLERIKELMKRPSKEGVRPIDAPILGCKVKYEPYYNERGELVLDEYGNIFPKVTVLPSHKPGIEYVSELRPSLLAQSIKKRQIEEALKNIRRLGESLLSAIPSMKEKELYKALNQLQSAESGLRQIIELLEYRLQREIGPQTSSISASPH